MAGASHAWFAVYLPGPDGGWFDFDPTHDLRPAEGHVTVAWGRDYGDVSPLKGVILGGGAHELTGAVDVVPVGWGGHATHPAPVTRPRPGAPAPPLLPGVPGMPQQVEELVGRQSRAQEVALGLVAPLRRRL